MRPNCKRTVLIGSRRHIASRLPVKGGIVVGCLCLGYLLFSHDSLLFDFQMRNEVKQLQNDIHHLQETNHGLSLEINRIQSDPAKLEELARNELGMVRKGERVYQFVAPPASAGNPASSAE